MKRLLSSLLLLGVLLTACRPSAGVGTPIVSTTPTHPAPQVSVTHAPDAQAAAQAFLQAWKDEDYAGMYAMLTRSSRDALKAEDFTNRYKDTAINLTLQKMDFEVLALLLNPTVAQVSYRVTFHTALVGDLQRDMVMSLNLEEGAWHIQWDPTIILPELRGDTRLAMEVKIPARGDIYDRNGKTIATQADAVALGIVPGQIDRETTLIEQLAILTGRTPQGVQALYEKAGADWYVPVGEATQQAVQDRMGVLSSLGGLVMNNYRSRYYFDGGIAPHVVGYVLSISKEQLEEYRRKGYRGDEKIGAAGLEKWGEEKLTGTRGASLYVVDAQGNPVTRLAQVDSRPGQSIYTTLDRDLQSQVQKAIEGFKGSAVVLERDTGRILAMASTPSFDPNVFEPTNYNSGWAMGDVLNDGNQRLLNRAAQGAGYPLGSVFKIITMAAALESKLYTPASTYDCGHTFTELPGVTFYDWTYTKGYKPSGLLTLPEGLMRSCNPWFYHLGLSLYRDKGAELVSGMARGFGLGNTVGNGQIAEAPGAMPDPTSDTDALQMAIGQGNMLVTPLQAVTFVAAVGNGGTLYRPQAVEKITNPGGDATYSFAPESFGKLPISPETLQTVRDAMRSVVANKRGTAFNSFTGINVPLYGKTGTAQNSAGNDHAWFAAYTDGNDPNKPNIALIVMAENAGEGSEIAAPIARRILEIYYDGRPSRLYPWEAQINVTRTPTPLATDTPVPQPTSISTPEPEPDSATATPIQ